MAAGGGPAFQLVAGDKYNFSLGVLCVFCLAVCKDLKQLPAFVRWNLNCYTNWNLTLIALRLALQQSQWDPFLCVNSMGVLMGFRTAMAQGLDENMRKKIGRIGLKVPRWLFLLLDHACHTAPVVVLLGVLARRKAKVPFVNAAYVMTLATWFAFRQQGELDSSGIYVPHPWRRTWLGILTGTMVTPPLVNRLSERRFKDAARVASILLLPWLSTRLDPGLKKKYTFEYAISTVASSSEPDAKRQASKPKQSMPRVASQPVYASSSLS